MQQVHTVLATISESDVPQEGVFSGATFDSELQRKYLVNGWRIQTYQYTGEYSTGGQGVRVRVLVVLTRDVEDRASKESGVLAAQEVVEV